MAKDRRSHGRKPKPGELAKRAKRQKARRLAWKVTENGAGARDIDNPRRHHRNKSLRMKDDTQDE